MENEIMKNIKKLLEEDKNISNIELYTNLEMSEVVKFNYGNKSFLINIEQFQ